MELIRNKFQQYGDLESTAYRGAINQVFYRIVCKLTVYISGGYFKSFFRSGEI